MSCRIENGRAILPNGKDSKLLKGLRDAVGSKAQADAMYESVYGEEFKKFYGFDFEKEGITQVERFANNLDENNEPRLFAGIGIYEFINNKWESFPVALSDKQQSRVLDLNRTEAENVEIQSELINTLIGFTNNLKIKAGVDNADIIFNTLKDKTLLAAFNNTIDIEKAKELFKTLNMGENGYDNFVKKIEEENISLAPMFDVFISAYEQWESTQDALGNIQTIGVRDILKNSFSRYNMRLRDGYSLLEEIDDEYVRIYNNSRLEDTPQNKLSSKANKVLLLDTNIITTLNWSITHFDGYCDSWIIKQAEFLKYDHYLITNIDIPWVKDDLRDRPNEREHMLSSLINEHDIRGLRYSIIAGDKPKRLDKAIEIINNIL